MSVSENHQSLRVVNLLRRRVTAFFLGAWTLAVIAVTIFPTEPGPGWAALPWWAMIHYIPFRVDADSFVLNIIMFMPFGVLVPLLWPRTRSWRRMLAWSAAASTTIEMTQLVLDITIGLRRTVDINDLISNVAGALAGLALLRLTVSKRHLATFDAQPAAVQPANVQPTNAQPGSPPRPDF